MKFICGPDLTEVDISLPEGKNKRILVAVSGGADSAILLYILSRINKELGTGHTLIPFTVPRPDGGANYSPDIVKFVSNKLGIDIPAPMIVGDGSLPHNIVVKIAIRMLMNSGNYDFIYVAENKVPDVDIGSVGPVRAPHNNFKNASMPFWGVTKECTLDLYFQENVPELLKLTHSCTEMTKGRCLRCFQCLERAWAFNLLDKEDPGEQ